MLLKDLRIKLCLSQEEVARKTGISKSSYSRYENGIREPDVRTAIRIAKALHTSVEELWGKSSAAV